MKQYLKTIVPGAAALALILLGTAPAPAATTDALPKGVKAPAEFDVTVFAAPPDVGYPTCLAAAPTGELFVGVDENGSLDAKPGRGRVVRCVDSDGDGRADQFKTFAEMDSPRGIWFDHGALYVMHPPFVTAFYDDNGDGVSDRSEVLVKGLGFDLKRRGADHTVNGMRMAIDGWLYIAVGDYGAIKAEGKDGTELRLHGGGVVRVRPNGTGLEIVSRGQRNIYDVAVSPELDLFTRDNTNDGGGWDVRLSHVVMGGYYGYPSRFMHFPEDIIQPLADYGGGAPCGSLFMDEPGFPQGLGTALYTCDWGRSKVYRHPLEGKGSTFRAQQESFIDIPRPTDMEVDGEGRIYVSSWSNGGFNYSGPNVGFVIRAVLKGAKPAAFPDLAKATDAGLVELLKSPSGVCRLHVQREILRRGPKGAFLESFEKLASSKAPIASRVAAIFTLEQLGGAGSQKALLEFAKLDSLREFALRALSDDKAQATNLPSQPFVAALRDANARVRLQAVTALARIGKSDTASAILPLTADVDPVVAHLAVNSLVELHAAGICLEAFDSASTASWISGSAQALQQMHEPRVAEGLIDRLNKNPEAAARQVIVKALCRLYQREADWDGRWWGTRPDTTGPYFKAVKWESSDKIGEVLRAALAGADAATLRWLVPALQRNQVDLPEVLPVALKLAKEDSAFREITIDSLAGRASAPEETMGLLEIIATSDQEKPALRIKALRILQRTLPRRAALEALVKAWLSTEEMPKPNPELTGFWEELTRDPKLGRSSASFIGLAESDVPGKRLLGYSVLLNLANHKLASRETKASTSQALERAWIKPEATVSLLDAIGRTHSDQYAFQVRALLTDARAEVNAAAARTARQLGLAKDAGSGSNQPLLDSMPYEQVVAQAVKEKGEAKTGAQLFLRLGCTACHTVSPDEPPKGPFLGGIATRYSRPELCESILKPSARIAQGFETQWFTTSAGDDLEGFVVREGGDEVEVRTIQGITATLGKKDIKERGKRETSIMPAGLTDKLTVQELASLLAYLESLKAK